MAKISKNQRPNLRGGLGSIKMAKVMVAVKKENGQYSFKHKMVPVDRVEETISKISA